MDNKAMEIKVERIHKLNTEGSLKGFADISVAGTFLIKGLRIVAGKNGLFISMPRKQNKEGLWHNTVYVLNKAIKEELSDIVLSAYE